jgi:hypothetical protein
VPPLLLLLLLTTRPQELAPLARVQKVSVREGGLALPLRDRDQFGRSLTALGDLDLDGVGELAVGAHGDDDGGLERGAFHVLFPRADGTVVQSVKSSALAPAFLGRLDDGDQLGRALAGIGDLDGDGIPDLAAGVCKDDDGGPERGAVWLSFLERDGSVRALAKISSTSGGLTGLVHRDEFGRAVCAPGDLDGDGVPDLVVGAPYDDGGGTNKGAVYLLTLQRDGSVKAQLELSQGRGGFGGPLRSGDLFGFSLAAPGDVDGDGFADLLVGAPGDDDLGLLNAGAVWLLHLGPELTVLRQTKLNVRTPVLGAQLHAGDQLGTGVAGLDDRDGDGRPELLLGAPKVDAGGLDRGAAWIVSLAPLGNVGSLQRLSSLAGEFPARIDNGDWFGCAVSALGDLDGDGDQELGIGARMDDDGGPNRGAIYLVFPGP